MRSALFPCDTAIERELGRTTITTGMPMQSRPVTLAMRVIPITGMKGHTRASVSAGVMERCVPWRYVLRIREARTGNRTCLFFARTGERSERLPSAGEGPGGPPVHLHLLAGEAVDRRGDADGRPSRVDGADGAGRLPARGRDCEARSEFDRHDGVPARVVRGAGA